MNPRHHFTLLCCCLSLTINQSLADDFNAEFSHYDDNFDKYKAERTDEYESYVFNSEEEYARFYREANAEYAKALKEETWKESEIREAVNPPLFVDPETEPQCTDAYFMDIVNCIVDKVQTFVRKFKTPRLFRPRPKAKDTSPSMPKSTLVSVATPSASAPVTDSLFCFDYYGTPCSVRMNKSEKFTLKSVEPADVANAWYEISNDSYRTTVNDCLWLRDSLHLNGWGYFRMLTLLCDEFLGNETNESSLLQGFMLLQSGYKVRLGRIGSYLVIMMPADYDIYSRKSVTLDSTKYFIFGECKSNDTFSLINVFTKQFTEHEQTMSLNIDSLPLLAQHSAPKKTFLTKATSYVPETISVEITPNINIINFFDDYPLNSNWVLYSMASLSGQIKEPLLQVLRKSIEGKSEYEQANIIINFVQTAFEYKTDREQFGYERPLFGDETFCYPYSDCEDRAILFSILIKELMHLDVVFIHYPNEHLSTAVRFNDIIRDIYGNEAPYINVEEQKYTMCDPTFIGATVGRVMPRFKDAHCNVIKIN